MHQVIEYFETLDQHPVQRMIILIAGLLFFWIVEGAIPLIQLSYKKNKWKHAAVNFSFTVIHLIIHTFLAFIIILISDWCKAAGFGVVYWTNAGTLATIFIALIFLDFFGGWLVHWTEHKTPLLWRFHTVHHADNNVDVTTGLRHHPIESVLRGVFFFLAIILSGAPMYAVMIFQTLAVIFTAFTHANISLPKWIDRPISFLFISPNMHKVHHHWMQPYTDSNYGLIFSVWDRIFGTYRHLDKNEIRYGLDRFYPNEHDENFFMLLKEPFRSNAYKE